MHLFHADAVTYELPPLFKYFTAARCAISSVDLSNLPELPEGKKKEAVLGEEISEERWVGQKAKSRSRKGAKQTQAGRTKGSGGGGV